MKGRRVVKSYRPKPSELEEQWYYVDAKDKVLGRLATQVSKVLLGKNDPRFMAGVDLKHHVVIVNTDQIAVTGRKMEKKKYYRHSGFTGGLKLRTMDEQMAKDSREVVRQAIKGMLPKNRFGHNLLSHLRIYAGSEHQHQAQKPAVLEI